MAHFAKIENDIVTQVIKIDNAHEHEGAVYIAGLGLEGEWIQTSINANFRNYYAGIGFTYNREGDVFIPPQPFPSWVLNSEWKWEAPIPQPSEGVWDWDEETQNWIEVTN